MKLLLLLQPYGQAGRLDQPPRCASMHSLVHLKALIIHHSTNMAGPPTAEPASQNSSCVETFTCCPGLEGVQDIEARLRSMLHHSDHCSSCVLQSLSWPSAYMTRLARQMR